MDLEEGRDAAQAPQAAAQHSHPVIDAAGETTKLTEVQDSMELDEKTECLICIEDLEKKEINLSCGHNNMHLACLAQWMEMKREASCPMCRRKIVKEEKK